MNPNVSKSTVFSVIVSLAINSNQDLIIQTPGGTIIGTPLLFENENQESPSALLGKALEKINSKEFNKSKSDSYGNVKDQVIFLKDVTIYNSQIMNLPFMTIFTDKIAGISLGTFE